jgi:hypothetical protein
MRKKGAGGVHTEKSVNDLREGDETLKLFWGVGVLFLLYVSAK